jgi:hypothetical protein
MKIRVMFPKLVNMESSTNKELSLRFVVSLQSSGGGQGFVAFRCNSKLHDLQFLRCFTL